MSRNQDLSPTPRRDEGIVRELARGKSSRTPFMLFAAVNFGLLLLAAVITLITFLALFLAGVL
jgi:hypothetical protein